MSTSPKAWQPCRSRCLHHVFSHSKRPNRAQYASVMGTPNRSSSIYPLVSLPGAGVTPYAGNSPILSYAINLKMLVGHLLRPIWIKSELATHSLNSNLIFSMGPLFYLVQSKVAVQKSFDDKVHIAWQKQPQPCVMFLLPYIPKKHIRRCMKGSIHSISML